MLLRRPLALPRGLRAAARAGLPLAFRRRGLTGEGRGLRLSARRRLAGALRGGEAVQNKQVTRRPPPGRGAAPPPRPRGLPGGRRGGGALGLRLLQRHGGPSGGCGWARSGAARPAYRPPRPASSCRRRKGPRRWRPLAERRSRCGGAGADVTPLSEAAGIRQRSGTGGRRRPMQGERGRERGLALLVGARQGVRGDGLGERPRGCPAPLRGEARRRAGRPEPGHAELDFSLERPGSARCAAWRPAVRRRGEAAVRQQPQIAASAVFPGCFPTAEGRDGPGTALLGACRCGTGEGGGPGGAGDRWQTQLGPRHPPVGEVETDLTVPLFFVAVPLFRHRSPLSALSQPACLMPHRERRLRRWSAGAQAVRCVHTCLWLGAAWIPSVLSHGLTRGTELDDGRAVAHGPGELAWAVSLDVPEEQVEQRAEQLARTAGLVNMGRIGELKGHYLFSYRPDSHAAPEPEAIRRSVDTLFAQHDSVRWHSEQKLLKRSKRSLHFNDPKYPQQWHLVSGFSAAGALCVVTGETSRGQSSSYLCLQQGGSRLRALRARRYNGRSSIRCCPCTAGALLCG